MKAGMTSRLMLYSTSACHLCEQARVLVEPLLGHAVELEIVDISDSDELFQRYGLSIPVLREEPSGFELGWPFDAAQVQRWLSSFSRL